jgi:dihydrolipoamide dehydrogenase
MEKEFDLIVIGSGPAGYTGAIRGAQLGMKVACVEKDSTLGGTCLNVGCIPSKALLTFSEKFDYLKNHAEDVGIKYDNLAVNIEKMISKKNTVVSELCKGIDMLFLKNKVVRLTGFAKILSQNEVEVHGVKYQTKNILIATGSVVTSLPNIKIDEKNIVSSTGALSFDAVPNSLVVIGGGYIGLELGSVWNRLGCAVTVVEYADRLVPNMDKEVSSTLKKILEKQGMKFVLSTKVLDVKSKMQKQEVSISANSDGAESSIIADKVLVAVGRKPFCEGLWDASLDIKTNERGFIIVDHNFQTSYDNVYAVGDVIPGPSLAHKAEEEAVAAVEIMNGQKPHLNYNLIPSVMYTSPEVANVGLTEEQAKESGMNYRIGKFPFLANSRARVIGATDGFVKIISNVENDRIIGAHIIGHDAGTMIAELVVAMEFYASAEDIYRTCHAHPTLSEAIKEACFNTEKRAINM